MTEEERQKKNAYQRAWYAENYARPRTVKTAEERREEKRVRDRESRRRRMEDPNYAEKIREAKKAWNEANPDKVRKHRKANLQQPSTKKRRAASHARRMRDDPQYAIAKRLRGRLYMAIKDSAKYDTTFELLGCTIPEFMAQLERQFLPGMTWSNRRLWHIDHIKPVSSFDLSDPEQQRLCFHHTNLQPLWILDNLKKGSAVASEPLD